VSTDTDSSVDHSIPRLDGKQDTGLLNYLVKDIDHLVRGSAWFQLDFSQCDQCGRSPNDLLQLESELHLTQEAADRLQRNLAEKTEESKRRDEEATSFKNQVLCTGAHYSIHSLSLPYLYDCIVHVIKKHRK
jgi:hypothetical protein